MFSWRRNLIWQLPLLAIVCFIASSVSERFDKELSRFLPETVANCSTYNDKASGYKGLYELAERVGKKCTRFNKSYRDLSAKNGVLIVVAPTEPMMTHDVDRVLAWVSKGNSCIYLDYCMYGSGRYLLEKIGVTSIVSDSLDDWKFTEIPKIEEMEHVKQMVLSSETRLRGGEVLVNDKHGSLAIRVKHGAGSIIIASLPNLCSNRRIAEKSNWGNFQFLMNCIASCDRVLFDERVHGYTDAQNAFIYLMRGPAGAITAQGLLIFLLLLLSQNQRFGPSKLVSNARRIASSEYIDGMAQTYIKARAHDTALSILFGSFHLRLCKALSLAPDEKVETIAQNWSQATKIAYEEALHFLKEAERLQASRSTTEEELVSVMKECDRLYESTKPYLAVQPGRRLGG